MIRVHSEETPFRALNAILLYGQHQPSYASIHDVRVDPDGGLSIEAGTSASVDGLKKLFETLDPSRVSHPTFLDPRLLSQGPSWSVWWVRPQTRRVWFKGSDFRKTSAEVPHPGLVFAVSPCGWYVFAVAGKTRPRPTTKLYQAPYLNIYEDGKICEGSMQRPDEAAPDDLDAWGACFFNSYFTHPNIHQPNRLVKYRGGPIRFWNAMLAGKYAKFPTEVLVPLNLSVEHLLENLGEDV